MFCCVSVKLEVKLRFKTSNVLTLSLLSTAFSLNITANTVVLLKIFAYLSNKRVINGLELNL